MGTINDITLTNNFGEQTSNEIDSISAAGAAKVLTAAAASQVTGKLLTGLAPAPGVVAATDSVLVAFNKLTGKGLVRVTVGFAALNTAGSGVAILLGDSIPNKAVITQSYYEVRTAFTDNGTAGNANTSTLALGLNSGVDVLAAAVISSAATAGIKSGIQTGTAANMLKLTAARQVSATWTHGSGDSTALTAGALDVFIEFSAGV